jgi:lipopolysaccharide biosynthesis glycosyltransferase
MKIVVLYCVDGNYWQHLGVAIFSLLHSNPGNTFQLIVASASPLDQERLNEVRSVVQACGNAEIETVVFEGTERYGHLPVHGYFTFANYLRLFMTEFVEASIDKIIYFDSDIIIRDDISDLWTINLGEYYIGAAPEPYDYKQRCELGFGPEDLYINSGVLLVNLAKWRNENVLRRFIEFAETNTHLLPSADQDILNCVLRGNILDVGYRWNWQALFPRFLPHELGLSAKEYETMRKHPKLVHFTSCYKPWYYRWAPHYKELYYEALAQTPWAGYIAPDDSYRNIPTKILKSLQRGLEWYFPRAAWRLRNIRHERSRGSDLVAGNAKLSEM